MESRQLVLEKQHFEWLQKQKEISTQSAFVCLYLQINYRLILLFASHLMLTGNIFLAKKCAVFNSIASCSLYRRDYNRSYDYPEPPKAEGGRMEGGKMVFDYSSDAATAGRCL